DDQRSAERSLDRATDASGPLHPRIGRTHRNPRGLRYLELRRMHCDTERQDREVMHDVCGPGQRWGDHHGGRTDEGWATSSAAGRIQTGARPAVRVLYAGHADVVARAARKKAESH